MDIVFLGTSDFGIPSLKLLSDDNRFHIQSVITPPDSKSERGQRLHSSPIKESALSLGLQVLENEKPSNPDFIADNLSLLECDVFVVISFGHILKKSLLSIPRIGAVNLHPSLLPQYRGPAPIPWAIMNGETEIGLTTFMLNIKVDAGGILLQDRIQIEPDEILGDLEDRLAVLGAPMVIKTLLGLMDKSLIPQEQSEEQATGAPKISNEFSKIDWNKPKEVIACFIRGLSPYYRPFTSLEGKRINMYRIISSTVIDDELKPGEIGVINKRRLFIGTATLPIEITELQPESKRSMTAVEFINGNPNLSGKILI